MSTLTVEHLGLKFSDSFSLEQSFRACQIWLPVLQRLKPVLCDLVRLEVACTPNGLIAESRAGWTLSMCCLEDAVNPHYISVRSKSANTTDVIKAILGDGSYIVRTEGDVKRSSRAVMQMTLKSLGLKRQQAVVSAEVALEPRRLTALR